jgi:hypothetical protein
VLWLDVFIIVVLNGLLATLLIEEVFSEQKLVVLLEELGFVKLIPYFEDFID